MKVDLKRHLNKIIRLTIIVFLVLFIEKGSYKIESKVVNENLNRTLDLTSMAEKVQEDIDNNIYASLDTYTGDLTGYVFNCPLCSGRLACAPNYDITDGKNTYNDELYGEVYIVASSKSLPCGSIVKFNTGRISDEPIVAVVLDRGVRGTALDFLAPSQEYALTKVGRSTITYDVLRTGWER